MLVVRSDVPKALVGIVDFNDATSAMLAAVVALSLPGLAGRIVIPSATGYGDLVPAGEHPLLDPLVVDGARRGGARPLPAARGQGRLARATTGPTSCR